MIPVGGDTWRKARYMGGQAPLLTSCNGTGWQQCFDNRRKPFADCHTFTTNVRTRGLPKATNPTEPSAIGATLCRRRATKTKAERLAGCARRRGFQAARGKTYENRGA